MPKPICSKLNQPPIRWRCFPASCGIGGGFAWPIDHFIRRDFRERNTGLRLSVEMENLPMMQLAERHVKAAPTELTVIYNDYALIHMVVKPFGHAVKSPDIPIQSANDIDITS